MSTQISRIPEIIYPFSPDNTGRNIDQFYQTSTMSNGTFYKVAFNQFNVYNLITAPTGSITININATNSQICDEMSILIAAAAATYSLSYGGDIVSNQYQTVTNTTITYLTATSGTTASITSSSVAYNDVFTVNVGQSVHYYGMFNGTEFIGNTTVK